MDVLIVEDHAMFRDLLRGILEDRLGCQHVEGVGSCQAAREVFDQRSLDLVVCDVDLPDGDGLDLADEFAVRNPRLRIIAVSSQTDEFTLSRVLRSGVIGFVDKTREDLKSLEYALREVIDWRTYYAMSVHQYKLAEMIDPHSFSKLLTDRELGLMRYFGAGFRNDEIARHIGVSSGTVQVHRRNIMRKLDITSAPELIRFAFRKGFTRVSDMTRQPSGD